MVETFWFLKTRVTIHVPSAQEAHGICVSEHECALGDLPPLHVHRAEDETFHVISGQLKLVVDGQESLAGPGATMRIPKGARHSYRVQSPTARFLCITGGGGFERLIRTMGRPPATAGLPPPMAPPSPEDVAALVQACADCGIDIVGSPLQ